MTKEFKKRTICWSKDIFSKEFWPLNGPEEFDNLLEKSRERIRKGCKKKDLYVTTPLASSFKYNERSNENAVPSGLDILDNDDALVDPQRLYDEVIKGHERELGIAYIERSCSGKTHIFAVCPEGMTVKESLDWLSSQLGISYDQACTDLARACYMTGNTIYRDDELLFGKYELKVDCKSNNESSTKEGGTMSVPLSYEGIPYPEIAEEWWRQHGGLPSEGTRNIGLFRYSSAMAGICDNNQELILSLMPQVGLEEKEMQSIVRSACKEPKMGIWEEMKRVLQVLKGEDKRWYAIDQMLIDTYLPSVMSHLPIGLRETLSKVPKERKLITLSALLPILGAYADGARAEYFISGEIQMTSLSCGVVGRASSGKSAIKRICDEWLTRINRDDQRGWNELEEYQEKKQTRAANKALPKKPHPLIRNIASIASQAYVVERLRDSKGHCLITVTDEINDINSKMDGGWDQLSQILRKAWGREEHSVGRVGTDSISAKVRVCWNITGFGTEGGFRRFFGNGNVENGLASRWLLSFITDQLGQRPAQFKQITDNDREAINKAITKLQEAQGVVATPKLNRAISQWCEGKRLLVEKYQDEVLDSFYHRSAVVGFRAGLIFHLLSGSEKESQTTIKAALLFAEYCLQGQIRFHADAIQKSLKSNISQQIHPGNWGCNRQLFNLLPSTFTYDDIMSLRPDLKRDSIKRMCKRWKDEERVNHIAEKTFEKQS